MNIQAPITHVDYEISNNTATNSNMFENTEVQDICFTNQQVLQQIRILYTSNRLKFFAITYSNQSTYNFISGTGSIYVGWTNT